MWARSAFDIAADAPRKKATVVPPPASATLPEVPPIQDKVTRRFALFTKMTRGFPDEEAALVQVFTEAGHGTMDNKGASSTLRGRGGEGTGGYSAGDDGHVSGYGGGF